MREAWNGSDIALYSLLKETIDASRGQVLQFKQAPQGAYPFILFPALRTAA